MSYIKTINIKGSCTVYDCLLFPLLYQGYLFGIGVERFGSVSGVEPSEFLRPSLSS